MNYVLKNQIMRLRCAIIPSAEKRSKWLKKHHIFYEMGENVHFQPRFYPADAKFVKLHNNIAIASNVGFITHDIMQKVFNNMPGDLTKFQSHLGCIEIMDNVFIGAGTRIMPDVRIGPNSIIAAGSVVTKDVPPGEVWGGVPAHRIGSFDEIMEARRMESLEISETRRLRRVEPEWKSFYAKRT